jgi:hypothetical protein
MACFTLGGKLNVPQNNCIVASLLPNRSLPQPIMPLPGGRVPFELAALSAIVRESEKKCQFYTMHWRARFSTAVASRPKNRHFRYLGPPTASAAHVRKAAAAPPDSCLPLAGNAFSKAPNARSGRSRL